MTREPHLQNHEFGVSKAFKEGPHDELVVVGNPVVSEVFPLVEHALGGAVLLVMQVAHPLGRVALCQVGHRVLGDLAVLRDVQRELLPAMTASVSCYHMCIRRLAMLTLPPLPDCLGEMNGTATLFVSAHSAAIQDRSRLAGSGLVIAGGRMLGPSVRHRVPAEAHLLDVSLPWTAIRECRWRFR